MSKSKRIRLSENVKALAAVTLIAAVIIASVVMWQPKSQSIDEEAAKQGVTVVNYERTHSFWRNLKCGKHKTSYVVTGTNTAGQAVKLYMCVGAFGARIQS